MSANTMSTSDPGAAGALTPELTSTAPVSPAGGNLPIGLAAPPDPAVIARLANEFFAALPWSSPPVSAAHGEGPPAESPVGAGTGPATEPEGRTLPLSFTGAAGLAPANPFAVPSQGAPGSPVTAFDGVRPSSPNTPPVFPAMLLSVPGGPDLHSLPGSPSLPSPPAPPTEAELRVLPASLGAATALVAVPSGAAPPSLGVAAYFLDTQGAAPLNIPPVIPPAGGLFSFPEGAVYPADAPASPSAASTDLPSESDLHAQATSPAGVRTEVPDLPGSGAPGSSSASTPETGPVGPFSAAPSLPSTGDMFNLPGVPGAQSAPGIPPLPSAPAPSAGGDPGAIQPSTVTTPGAPEVPAAASPAAAGGSPSESVEVHPEVVPDLGTSKRPFDPYLIRGDFPILQEQVHGKPLIWLDNAATTQKPKAVIDRLSSFYRHENSNIHRAAHALAARATDAYESAREKVRRFLNAPSTRDIIFVRGTTEGINLVAKSWGARNVQKGDEVVITWLEHHSNIVPWQQLCAEKGACLRVAPVDDRGQIILERYERLLGPRTRIVALSHVSNALGTITPAREMIEMAHRYGALVLVDGAQSAAHMREDVQALDCDFFVFSGHKIFGPTGIGVVYGKESVLEHTPPWQGGGGMILDVTFEKTVYNVPPARFEAGTGNIADAVGLGVALDYLSEVGIENVARHEHDLLNYATAGLGTVPGLRIIGTAAEKAGVISFVLDETRPEDVGSALDQEGIAVRAGHHCAQPILRRFGLEATVRPSLALYNTREDIDALVAALLRIQAGRGHRKL